MADSVVLELAAAEEGGEAGEVEALIISELKRHHERGVARLNNGSFGCCPASVRAAQAQWQDLWLSHPDHFYFGPLQDAILRSCCALASVIRAPNADQVVLVDNVTVAVSMVLQNMAWDFFEGRHQKGDAVLATNFSYRSVKKALRAYVVRAGAHLIEVTLPFPVSCGREIVAAFQAALEQAQAEGRRIVLALIDHVACMPTMVLPVQELVRLCREAGVGQIFVDGAHAIGNVDVDVQDIDADYYTSNVHKWLFNPPSAAFLYCKMPERLGELHHPIVSHHYGEGLRRECEWVGTRDYSAQVVIADAVHFFSKFKGGMRAVQDYNHSRVVSMGEMLAKAWGTHCGTPPDMSSSMVMVGLPNLLGVRCYDDALNLRTRLREEYRVEAFVFYNSAPSDDAPSQLAESLPGLLLEGDAGRTTPLTAYVRVSHQIYNSLSDYEQLRDAVKALTSAAAARTSWEGSTMSSDLSLRGAGSAGTVELGRGETSVRAPTTQISVVTRAPDQMDCQLVAA